MYCLYRAVADHALGSDRAILLSVLPSCRCSSDGRVLIPAFSEQDVNGILGALRRRLRNGLRITRRLLNMEEGVILRYLASSRSPQTLWLIVPIGNSTFFLVGDQEFSPFDGSENQETIRVREEIRRIAEIELDTSLPHALNSRYGRGAWNGLINTPIARGIVEGSLDAPPQPTKIPLPGTIRGLITGDTTIFSVSITENSGNKQILQLTEIPSNGDIVQEITNKWRSGSFLTLWGREIWNDEQRISALPLLRPV